ncbi:MAG: hypothetical protein ACYC77_11155 [Coriobacteriia bacterium]
MNASEWWDRRIQSVVAIALIVWIAAGTYTGDRWVFPLSYADLGFHELGHMLTMFWAPQPVVAFAGSFTQVAVPLGFAVYFHFVRKQPLATSHMVAWAGSSASNVAIYIADATRRVLPLLGGQDGHDWAYLLGPGVLNALDATDAVAAGMQVFAAMLFASAVGVVVIGYFAPVAAARRAEQHREYLEALPVREPGNPSR